AGEVPGVSGFSVGEARDRLESIGLEVAEETSQEYNNGVDEGLVIGYSTDQETLAPGDTVTLVESLGPQPVEIPSVDGMTRDEAVKTLEDLGFEVSFNGLWSTWPDEWTTVTGSDPAAGTSHVPAETTVTIYIDNVGPV